MAKTKSQNKAKFTESVPTFEELFENITLTEANPNSDGYRYRIRIIKSGRTTAANTTRLYQGRNVQTYQEYPEDTLKKVVEDRLLEGIPVMIRGVAAHLNAENTGIDKVIGTTGEIVWNDSDKCIEGYLNVKRGKGLAEVMRSALKQLWESTKDIGLSIAAFGKTEIFSEAGKFIARAIEINEFQSVDIVPQGNAGGLIVKLVEALSNNHSEENSMKQKLWALLLKAGKVKATDKIEDFTEDKLLTMVDKIEVGKAEPVEKLKEDQRKTMFEALKKSGAVKDTDKIEDFKDDKLFELMGTVEFKKAEPETKKEPEGGGNKEPDPVKEAQAILNKANAATTKVEEGLAKIEEKETISDAKAVLAESKLPPKVKDKVMKQFEGYLKKPADLERFKTTLKEEQEILAEMVPNGGFKFSDDKTKIQLLNSQTDKVSATVDMLLCPANLREKLIEAYPERKELYTAIKGQGRVSLKEVYIMLTGDTGVTGRVDNTKLTEGLTSASWAEVFGDSMRRVMLMEYQNGLIAWDEWRKIASVGETPDFRAKRYIEIGGYSDLPTVAEDADFEETTSPTDHEATLQASKKGYIDRITREMIINDDLNAVARIPKKMAAAAKRTLYKAVFNPIINNSNIYDGTALYTVAHENLLTDALNEDGVALGKARQMLKDMKEKDNAEKLGIRAKYLLFPSTQAMTETAYKLTTGAYGSVNNIPKIFQTWGIEPVEVVTWNSQTNWRLMADPNENPTVQVDFLQGKQEPELFIQDQITSDTFFVKERIRYKIRHEYGIAVLSFKTSVGSEVPAP